MKISQFRQIVLSKLRMPLIAIPLILILGSILAAQTVEIKFRNNPYSPSPERKSSKPEQVATSGKQTSESGNVSFIMHRTSEPVIESRPSASSKTFQIGKSSELSSRPLTEIYRVGIGDILFVNLRNSPQGSGHYVVRPDGTIDFPLAGENVIVADQTVETIAESLSANISLYAKPQIEVKVRQYASHKITVSGLVNIAGEKSLQREAMPLFVIKAEAAVSPDAKKVLITRQHSSKVESYDLNDPKNDNVLVYAGDSIKFEMDRRNDIANEEF